MSVVAGADPTFNYGKDLCLSFFALAWPRLFDFPIGAKVLEVGCAEADWLTPMKKARPDLHLTGIDWRACKRPGADVLVLGDVLTANFAPESFDAIVCISSLEHVGLGHYSSDPVDTLGDIRCAHSMYKWLKPGGLIYFDVPWNPDPGYRVLGTETRVYDDTSLAERFALRGWAERHRLYICRRLEREANGNEHYLVGARPFVAHPRFHYVSCIWQKPVPIEYLG